VCKKLKSCDVGVTEERVLAFLGEYRRDRLEILLIHCGVGVSIEHLDRKEISIKNMIHLNLEDPSTDPKSKKK
jgi:hypothetical protein